MICEHDEMFVQPACMDTRRLCRPKCLSENSIVSPQSENSKPTIEAVQRTRFRPVLNSDSTAGLADVNNAIGTSTAWVLVEKTWQTSCQFKPLIGLTHWFLFYKKNMHCPNFFACPAVARSESPKRGRPSNACDRSRFSALGVIACSSTNITL